MPALSKAMSRFASALSVFALAAAPAAAQEAARDFQLPPAPAATQEPRVQGPVDTEGAVPVRPRVIETGRPAAPTPSPTATAQPAPTIVLPGPVVTSAQRPTGAPAAIPAPLPRGAAAGIPTVAAPLPPVDQTNQTLPAAAPSITVSSTGAIGPAIASPSAVAKAEDGKSLIWPWIVLGLLIAAGTALFLFRRRREPETPTIVAPLAAAGVVPHAQPADALAISVEAVRMDRSVMNATVGYRVTLRNRTAQALSALAIEADLVSASKESPAEVQLASRNHALTPRHTAERLAPGQSVRFEGQVRLPLAEASAIWQGRVGLLVPLLKVRATAAEATPVATTLVIGRREGAAARPQPFRLDEPPRSYAPLAQRVLDAVATRA